MSGTDDRRAAGAAGGRGAPHAGARRTASRVLVGGDVQGVFFRDSCAREARRNGVAGWVCNRADGRVEAWFEGDARAVENMVRWCRQGPPRARVESIEVTEESPAGVDDFRIQ
jgi:acylphosphatase